MSARRRIPLRGDLEELRGVLSREVDAAAARQFALYLTPGIDAAYQEKRREVERWRSEGSPAAVSDPDYPWALERANRRGVPIAGVLKEWAARMDALSELGRRVDAAREAAKEKIAAAVDVLAARKAASSVSWPTPGDL